MEKKIEQPIENKVEKSDFDKQVEDRKDVRLIDLEGIDDIESVVIGGAACNKASM